MESMTSGSLETLPESLLGEISQRAATRTYAKNAVIVAEGEESDSLYLLLFGHAKVYTVDGKGNEIRLKQLGPGEYFGEVALDGGPRSASVMATESCRCAVVQRADLGEFMEEYPEFALHLVRKLAHRVRELSGSMRDLAFVDVYGRVARMLLELAKDQDGRLVIAERPTDEGIAARIGATPGMVSGILADLVESGYLAAEGDQLIVRRRPPTLW